MTEKLSTNLYETLCKASINQKVRLDIFAVGELIEEGYLTVSVSGNLIVTEKGSNLLQSSNGEYHFYKLNTFG